MKKYLLVYALPDGRFGNVGATIGILNVEAVRQAEAKIARDSKVSSAVIVNIIEMGA